MTFKKDKFNNESINELIISPDTDNDLAKVDQKFDVGIQPYNNPIHDKYRDPKPILLEPYSKAANMEIIPTEKDVEYRGVWVDSSEIEDKIDDFEEIKEDYYRIILDQNDNAPALDKVLEKLTNEEIIKAKYLLSTKIKKDNYDETILHVNENLRQEEIIFETKDAKFPRIFREIKFRVNVSFTDLGYMNFYRKDGTQIVYKRHDGRSLLYQTLPVIIARHKLNLELKEEQEIRDIVAADPDYYGLRFTSSRIGEAIPEPLSNFVGYILVHVVSTKPINLPRLFRTDALSIKDYLKEESLYRAKLTKYIEFWAKEVKPSNDDFIDNDVLNQKYQNELENFENMKNSTKQTVIDHIELLKSKIYDTFKQTQIAKDDFKDRYKTNIYENAFKISKLQYKKFWAKLGDLLRTRRSLRRKITYLLYILNKLDTLSKEDIEAKDLFRITNVFLLQNFPTKKINELNEHLPNVKIESLLLEKTGTTENFKRFESDLRFVINHENTFVDANIDDFGVFANKQIPTLNKNHTNNYINYYIQLVQNHKTTLSDALKASWYETLKYFKPSTEVTEILKPLFYRHVEQEITEFRLFKNMHSRDKFLIAWMDETVILDEPHPLWKAIVYPSYTIQTINKLNHRVEDIMHAAERMHTHTYKSQVRKYTREAKQKIINKYEHILKKYKTQKLKIIKLKKEQARSLQKITIKDQLYYNVYNENLVLQKNKYVNWEIRNLQNKVFKIVYKKINFGTEEKPLHYFFHIKKLEYVGNNYSFETREKKDNSTELVWKNIYKHLYTKKLFLEELNIRMEECHHTASQIMRKYNDLYHFNEIITSTEIKSTSKLLYVFYANLKMEKKQILANKIDFEELSDKLSPVKDYFEIYKMVDWDDKEDKALQEIENVKKQYSKLREEKTSWNMLKAYKNKQLRKHQQLTDEYIKEIKSTPTTYLFDEKAVVSMQHRTFPKLYKNIELANIIHLEILINYLYRHIFKALKILQRHYSKNSTQQKFKRKLYYHKQKEKKRVDKIKEKQEAIRAQFIYNEIQEEKELQKNLEKDRKVLEKKQKTINKEYKKNARGLKNWRIELNKELKASNKILKNLEGTPINDNKIQEEKEIQKAIEKDFKALEKQQNSLDEEYKKKQEELNIEEMELNKKFEDSNKVLKPLDEEYKKIQEIRSEKFKKQFEKIKKQNEKKKKE